MAKSTQDKDGSGAYARRGRESMAPAMIMFFVVAVVLGGLGVTLAGIASSW